jgi:hypothetical protein
MDGAPTPRFRDTLTTRRPQPAVLHTDSRDAIATVTSRFSSWPGELSRPCLLASQADYFFLFGFAAWAII